MNASSDTQFVKHESLLVSSNSMKAQTGPVLVVAFLSVSVGKRERMWTC